MNRNKRKNLILDVQVNGQGLRKHNLRNMVELLKEQCRLNGHFNVTKVVNDPLCRGFKYGGETALHVLCSWEV